MEKLIKNGPSKNLSGSILEASRKSRNAIKNILEDSTRSLDFSLDTNKRFIDSIECQVKENGFADTTIIGDVSKVFDNSAELSEEAIDTIIEIQTAQLQAAIDFNVKLINYIRRGDLSDKNNVDQLVGIIEKNFEDLSARLIDNSKRMTEIYNRHINLALNFNERFSKDINSKMDMLNRFQSKNMDMFNDWASHWWKTTTKDESEE